MFFDGRDDPWFCFKSNSDILPFGKLNNQNFKSFVLFSQMHLQMQTIIKKVVPYC